MRDKEARKGLRRQARQVWLRKVSVSLAPPFASSSIGSFGFALVQLLIHRLELLTLRQNHFRDRVSVLERRDDADSLVTLVYLEGLLECRTKRPLRLLHRLALGLGSPEILPLRYCLDVHDLAAERIHPDLGELVSLHRIDRELELPVLHLELG